MGSPQNGMAKPPLMASPTANTISAFSPSIGLGTTKNLGAAYQWFALAANNGDTEAAKRRDLVKVQLDPQTLAAAEQAVKAGRRNRPCRRPMRSP